LLDAIIRPGQNRHCTLSFAARLPSWGCTANA